MAKRLAGRFGYPPYAPGATGGGTVGAGAALPGGPKSDPFQVTFHPNRLDLPTKWKKPRRIFVNSMGDLFHEDVPREIHEEIFARMCLMKWHTFMILTKRPERMKLAFGGRVVPANVWLGVTAENQARADERIPILLEIPAAVHFVSVEPMLGPVGLEQYFLSDADKAAHEDQLLEPIEGFNYRKIRWVIAGPETGPRARECEGWWIQHLAAECKQAGIPFFDKRGSAFVRQWPEKATPLPARLRG